MTPSPRRRLRFIHWAVFALLLSGLLQSSFAESLSVMPATDIVQNWQPGQRLYVNGEVGMSQEQQTALENWLDANGPNWTVLICQSGLGEKWRDAQGRYTERAAVEMALSRGLAQRPDFKALTDQRTGEKNGVILAIYLEERKFSYWAAEAYERRGLGSARWAGVLDRPAVNAMRSGKGPMGAVTDTVTFVNNQFSAAVAGTIAEQAREKENRAALIQQQRGRVRDLQARLQSIGAQTAGKQGPLAQVPPAWSQGLTDVDTGMETIGPKNAEVTLTKLERAIKEREQLLQEHGRAPAQFKDLGDSLKGEDGLLQGESAAQLLKESKSRLAAAQKTREAGELTFADEFAAAQASLAQARTADEQHRQEQIEAAAAAKRRNNTLAGTAGAGIVGLGALGYFASRRRHPLKAEAEALIDTWDKALKEKTPQLFALLDKSVVVAGNQASLDKSKYTGETMRLSREALRDVDELFILSTCAKRVLGEAQALIRPGNLFKRSKNVVSGDNYQQAIRLLRETPVKFQPGEELASLTDQKGDAKLPLVADRSGYQGFSLSFTELMAEFDLRANRVKTTLNLLEDAWQEVAPTSEATLAQIRELQALEAPLKEAAAHDGRFVLAPLFAEVAPRALQYLDEAIKLSAADPVGATALPLALSQSLASEGLELAKTIAQARGETLPNLQGDTALLEGTGYSVAWVDELLALQAKEAEELAASAVEFELSEGIADVRANLEDLSQRVKRTRELAAELQKDWKPRLGAEEQKLAAAKQELGKALGLSPGAVLEEPGEQHPGGALAQARKEMEAARTALGHGGVEGAQEAFAAAASLFQRAGETIAATRNAFQAYPKVSTERDHDNRALTALLPERQVLMEAMKERYSESALRASAGNNGVGFGLEVAARAGENLRASRAEVERAAEAQRTGRLLAAQAHLQSAEVRQKEARALLDSISAHSERLQKVETENAGRLQQLEAGFARQARLENEPTLQRSTLARFDVVASQWAEVQRAARSHPADPFAQAAQMEKVTMELRELDRLVLVDKELYEELNRSLQHAGAVLQQAEHLAQEARADRIPDSVAISTALRALEQLPARHAKLIQAAAQAHGDWLGLDKQADALAARAEEVVAALRTDLQQAKAIVATLESVGNSVRQASNWEGYHGVGINLQDGRERYEAARQSLLAGDYLSAQAFAEQARRSVEQAQIAANAEVRRLQEEEERARRYRHGGGLGGGGGLGNVLTGVLIGSVFSGGRAHGHDGVGSAFGGEGGDDSSFGGGGSDMGSSSFGGNDSSSGSDMGSSEW